MPEIRDATFEGNRLGDLTRDELLEVIEHIIGRVQDVSRRMDLADLRQPPSRLYGPKYPPL